MTRKERRERAADRAGAARIRELLAGTSWGGRQPSLPRSNTERSRKFRESSRELGEIPAPADAERRRAATESLMAFGLAYCLGPGRMLKRPPSPSMGAFVDALEQTVRHGGCRHVRWPRGKGKSTWLKIAALWSLVTGLRRFVVVIAATRPMADVAVAELWRYCSEDSVFAADWPEFAVPLADVALTPQRCRLQTFRGVKTHICENARYSYKRFAELDGYPQTGGIIAARGADQAIRGLNIDSMRPDFIFLDDPQTDEDARSTGPGGQVDKIERRIQGAIQGLGDAGATPAAVMASTPIEPDDVSERYADPERHGEWLTTTTPLVVSFGPEEWRDRYLAELRRDDAAKDAARATSRAFYAAHRADIERGAEVLDEADFDPAIEVSAYQHALNRLHAMKARAFNSECQMRPSRERGVFRLDAARVASRVNGHAFGEVPAACGNGVLAFVDVNDVVGLRWEVVAFGAGRVAATLAYGRHPERGRLYPEGTPLSAVPSFLAPAMREVAAAIRAARFRRADGTEARVAAICFDGGWQTETVAQTCAELDRAGGAFVVWSKGFDSRHYSRNHHEKAKTTEGCRAAEECHTWLTANGRYLAFNADYWREVSQSSFLAAPLSPSSSSLWGTDPDAHWDYAAEVAAEVLEAKASDVRYGDVWKWRKTGENHFGDTHAGCLAFGAIRGDFDPLAKLSADGVVAAAKAKRRVRYAFNWD